MLTKRVSASGGKKIKKYLLAFLLLEMLFTYTQPYANAQDYTANNTNPVSSQIEQYLCAPSKVDPSQTNTLIDKANVDYAAANNNNSGDLFKCINQIYKFAIVVAVVFGVFFIVIAGYIYMSAEGNQESVDKAKSIITSTIASLVILFSAFLLLQTLNPDLVKFQNIQPPSVVLPNAEVPGTATDPGTVTQPAKILANTILSKPQITLSTVHPSGNVDAANAAQNIKDTSLGNPAQRSSYTDGGIKGPGGSISLTQIMLQGMVVLSGQFSFRVSEIAGGVHSNEPNDSHYTGRAFDVDQINGKPVNSNNPDYKAFEQGCKNAGAVQVLGPGDAGHDTHIHCGWAVGSATSS